MSLIVCGSIHQGHERFIILVLSHDEDKRFLCLAAILFLPICDRMERNAKISIKSFFMEIIFFLVHSVAVKLGKNASIRSKLPTAACRSREKRGRCETNLVYIESDFATARQSST